MSYAVDGFVRAQARLIIGEAQCVAAFGHACQLSAALPRHSPATVAKRVAYAVVCYLLAIVRGQKVAPLSVAVGVGSSRSAAADCAAAGASVFRPPFYSFRDAFSA